MDQNTTPTSEPPRLNETQRRAVTGGDGPTLVLAGAGSGKTRVIVERLVYLIEERGVDPRNLLAMTFTNRAANEMKARVAQRTGQARLAAWVGTYHSFGLFVLRREIERLGRSKALTVFDDSDQLALMKRLVSDLPAGLTPVTPRHALSWMSRLKQALKKPDPARLERRDDGPTLLHLWSAYHDALIRAGGVDFDDLLVLPARLFDEHPDVREKYSRRYAYIHVDEYQDTNRAQYWIVKRLSEVHGNVFVVGDEDQSIYSWRGADLNNVLDFQKDFPNAQVIRLEQNYRSTESILAVANAVVSNNAKRLGKTLWTGLKGGEKVRIYEARSGNDEAAWVAADIAASGVPLNEVAVLYRTHSQSRLFEEALRRKGLHYVVIGGVQFYGRKEVKDLLAYLRVLVNPADDVSLRRILNVPTRGIGAATLEYLGEQAAARGTTLFTALRDAEHDVSLGAAPRRALAGFVALMDDLTLAAKSLAVPDLVRTVLEKTGYRAFVQQTDEKNATERIEIIEEFINACTDFTQSGATLEVFLQDLALWSSHDDADKEAPAVKLVTCHAAKGLEFDAVYLVGLEQGLLPHATAEADGDIEEERRLCYVAMTRARRRLTLTYAERRMLYGQDREHEPSIFLAEVPRDRVVRVYRDGPLKPVPLPEPKVDESAIRMGTRVRHATFGAGTVMYVIGSGKKMRVKVRFQTGRTRELALSHAPLEILE